jgi:hypothetical protein
MVPIEVVGVNRLWGTLTLPNCNKTVMVDTSQQMYTFVVVTGDEMLTHYLHFCLP